jgi:hypothetical protein
MRTPVDRTIGFAPGAEENPLARWAHDTIRRRLFPDSAGPSHWRQPGAAAAGSTSPERGRSIEMDPRARRRLFAMRATVAMVARDRRLSTTLRFDHGSLMVHDGMAGIPEVTFCADYDVLVGLAGMPLSRFGLPLGAPWHALGLEVLAGELKIYGLVSHPRLVLRVLRLMAAP